LSLVGRLPAAAGAGPGGRRLRGCREHSTNASPAGS